MADLHSLICAVVQCEALKLKHRRSREKARSELIRIISARRKRLQGFFFLFLNEFILADNERRFWVQPGRTSCFFWENTVSSWVGKDFESLWIQNFRLSRSLFEFVCNKLNGRLVKEDTKLRKSIPVQKRIAVCIWHLATGEDLRSLAWRFDIGKSTACMIIKEVCQSIVDVLLPLCIRWPVGERLEEIIEGFSLKWNFPQCGGAIDGTHIPIVAPPEHSSDFYNRKGFYSIVMQAVVDHAHRFTDIYIKWPGRVHDARVLKNSLIYIKGQSGELFPDKMREISGVSVPVMLIGDPAYPLLPWLMKGFSDNGSLNAEQVLFNYQLSRARMVVEAAFGRLKGRFRCLLKRNDTSLQYLPTKIAACCVLHNLCEFRNEVFEDEWLDGMNREIDRECSRDSEDEGDANAVRNALVDYFYSE